MSQCVQMFSSDSFSVDTVYGGLNIWTPFVEFIDVQASMYTSIPNPDCYYYRIAYQTLTQHFTDEDRVTQMLGVVLSKSNSL